jgi:hypothetical protein
MDATPFEFTAEQVDFVSSFLQGHMARRNIASLTADECAELLDQSGLLAAAGHPKKGFRFRQMLRDGRDGKIALVEGARQERPKTQWLIQRIIPAI